MYYYVELQYLVDVYSSPCFTGTYELLTVYIDHLLVPRCTTVYYSIYYVFITFSVAYCCVSPSLWYTALRYTTYMYTTTKACSMYICYSPIVNKACCPIVNTACCPIVNTACFLPLETRPALVARSDLQPSMRLS